MKYDAQLTLCTAYCGNPLPAATNNYSSPRVIVYSDLPTTVYFSCPSELVLTGPNTTMCVNNSRWEPDPSKVMCTKTEGTKCIKCDFPLSSESPLPQFIHGNMITSSFYKDIVRQLVSLASLSYVFQLFHTSMAVKKVVAWLLKCLHSKFNDQ